MPYINVKTNSSKVNEAAEALKAELGNAITAIPGKSEGWLMVNVEKSDNMYFKGDGAPCAMFDVSIYGSADRSAYDNLTQLLCAASEKYLDVPAGRTYVKYTENSTWGWNNMNF